MSKMIPSVRLLMKRLQRGTVLIIIHMHSVQGGTTTKVSTLAFRPKHQLEHIKGSSPWVLVKRWGYLSTRTHRTQPSCVSIL